MTNPSIFDVVKERDNYTMKQSWQWFLYNARQISDSKRLKNAPLGMFTDNQPLLTPKLMPGFMYMYFYDPKGKDELPFYDTFPLLLPFSMDDKHFTGLNMHYLPPKFRHILMTKLLRYANDKNMGEKTKLMMSWNLLSNAAKFPEVAPCVKQYLKGYVKSRFLKIKPEDYMIAVSLPLERFKKAENDYVWRKSREQIKK